jgi:PAS domain S-box-containing protein
MMSSRPASRRALSELRRAQDIRLTPAVSVGLGVILGALAVLLRALFIEIASDPGFIFFAAAVFVAAWWGGTLGGLVALAMTVGLHGLLLLDTLQTTESEPGGELFKLFVYALVGALVVLVVGSRRRSRDRLEMALGEVASLAQAVEARDERLELVLGASDTGLWEWDMLTGDLVWSDAIARQHGLPPGSAPDFEGYLRMIHPHDVKRFRSAVEGAVENGTEFDLEFRIIREDGTVRWTRGAGRVFRDAQGRPSRMVGTGQDITERRRFEADRDQLLDDERRARQFRDAFIDVLSHELRTPVTTILGMTELLSRSDRDEDPEARAALLSDVHADAERLHRLVEDLLVMSRVEHQRLVVEMEPMEPRKLLGRIVAWLQAAYPSLDLELELDPHLPIVAGEASYVEQVLRNLIDNSAKYTPRGSPVRVTARPEEDGIAVRVLDEGAGIPEGSTERLFELFYRDPDLARTVAGSGIGLFVCSSLVKAMGGRMWAETRPEGGSEFGFTLRGIEADDDMLLGEAGELGRTAPAPGGPPRTEPTTGTAPGRPARRGGAAQERDPAMPGQATEGPAAATAGRVRGGA